MTEARCYTCGRAVGEQHRDDCPRGPGRDGQRGAFGVLHVTTSKLAKAATCITPGMKAGTAEAKQLIREAIEELAEALENARHPAQLPDDLPLA